MTIFADIAGAFQSGGIWMYAILAAQIVSIAIIAERLYALYGVRHAHQKELAQKFENDIRKGEIEKVIARAQNLGATNAIGSVVQAGAQAAMDMGGREEIQ